MTNEDTPNSLIDVANKKKKQRKAKARDSIKNANSLKERVKAIEEYLGVDSE